MKIGIFDPNLDSRGHYLKFNWHIVKLFEGNDNEIIFFDVNNIFRNNWKERLSRIKNIKIINVANTTVTELSGKSFFPVRDFFWCKKTFEKIKESKIDFLIITSEGYFFLNFFIPKVKFAIIFHRIDSALFFKNKYSIKYIVQTIRKKIILRFIRRAEIVFVLTEYFKEKTKNLSLKRVECIPYLCFESFNNKIFSENEVEKFVISTPGSIYYGKNIDFILETYKKYNLNFKYIIAGFPSGSYGKKIVKIVESLQKNAPITSVFKYLSDEEYKKIIQHSSFVLLPYSTERTSGISAVMLDAFENNTPIISPDIEPFRYFVNKYKLGLLYEANNQDSFIKALNIASKILKKDFADNFLRFKKKFSYDKNREKFKKMISEII